VDASIGRGADGGRDRAKRLLSAAKRTFCR
jgi:hypothetical protein